MLIFPAIDIYEKQAVRLYKGDYAQKTVYGEPIFFAEKFVEAGAKCVHLVDLEGAKSGATPNADVIAKIKKTTGLFCEVGGGIRTLDVVNAYFDVGVDRVIIGTAAVENRDFLQKALSIYGERISVGVDISDGYVAVKGWTQKSSVKADDMFKDMSDLGVKTVICTDISRDGAMLGSNRALYRDLSSYNLNIIASGGVSSIEDVVELKNVGVYGAIIGKAYYLGAIDLKEALEVAK